MEQRIKWLIGQMPLRTLDAAEQEELEVLLAAGGYDALIAEAIEETLTFEEDDAFDREAAQRRMFAILALDKGGQDRGPRKDRVRVLWQGTWMRYAAVVLIAAGITLWYIYFANHRSGIRRVEESEIAAAFPDSKPGEDKALLTLDDGSTLLLDSTGNGLLSRQGHSNVMKVRGGELVYEEADHENPATGTGKIYYNTVNVPRGGQFRVVLPDGSKVWLNAASSLRFPTVFAGGTREVFVTGEAYFEIAPNAGRPFYARVEGLSVEVLGTSFNINAYKDENTVRTTLLDGKVRVRANQAEAVMQPGQQAEVARNDRDMPDAGKRDAIKLSGRANINQAMAWKNGEFYLDNTDIAALMRQIGRWYAIDVEFEGDVPSGHITGKVPRSTALPKILRLLKLSGVHFRIEDKKIIVSP